MASDAITEPRQATREEMRDAKLPLAYRDSCAHLLIPLNKCRRDTWYAPWKCSSLSPRKPKSAATPSSAQPNPAQPSFSSTKSRSLPRYQHQYQYQ
ncbi:hypothetical protein LB504_001431 [Fusarium proliferatum]|nr:hypothetical protein LB504_001431 [Fusarium proliferatum]